MKCLGCVRQIPAAAGCEKNLHRLSVCSNHAP
jgi:hypothetical protein